MVAVGSKIKLKDLVARMFIRTADKTNTGVTITRKICVLDNVGEICVLDNVGEIFEVVNIIEDGTICFKFGGCHLGYMSYETYEKYFDSVEDEKRRMWSSWRYVSCEHPIEMETLAFKDVAGVFHTFDVMYREMVKKCK